MHSNEFNRKLISATKKNLVGTSPTKLAEVHMPAAVAQRDWIVVAAIAELLIGNTDE